MGGRLKLDEVRCEVQDGRIRARVHLSKGGLAHIGLAAGTLPDATCERVIAQATLNAVRQFTLFAGAERTIVLHDLDVVPSPSAPTVLVSLRLGEGDDSRFLSGSAPVRDEVNLATARAVLDGINRQVEGLLN
jgi:hypothetical protein